MDLDALRARIDEILERLAGDGLTTLSDEELSATQDELLDCFNEARTLSGAEGLAEATRCREGIVSVKEQRGARIEEAARISAEFDALAAELEDPEEAEVADPEAADPADPEAPAEDPEPATAEDPEPAEVEVVEAPAAEVPVPVPAGVATASPVSTRAPAAAQAAVAVAPASKGPSLRQAAAARRETVPAVPKAAPITAKFTFAEDGSVSPTNRREVAEKLASVHDRWARSTGISMNIPVLHAEWTYPEQRDLNDIAQSPEAVTRRFDEQMGPQALTAAGGICAPFPVDYSLLNIAEDVRPVAANLPSYGAPRGGIQFMPSYVLSDITADAASGAGAAIGRITRTQDAAGSPSKPCQTFTCKTVTSCEVYAITRCVTFGNWNQRFYPELIDNILSQVMAVQARFAEELLLSAICAGSTAIDFNGFSLNGATASLLAAVGRAAARLRHANRAPGATIRVAFPDWVRDLVREDMSSRLAYGNEQYNIPDVWWDQQLALRGVRPWYFIDGENDIQELRAPLTQGPLPAFPRTVKFYMYFEGAWTFLDGGTMDLGIVRDSVLNPANNFQMFAETWEGLCNRGLPSLCVNATVCPSGASAGTFAPDVCGS